MMVVVKDGSSDFAKLQSVTNQIVANAGSQSALQTVFTSFRAATPQLYVSVNRIKAETLGITVGQVFSALENYLGSSLRHPVQQVRRRSSRSMRRPTPSTACGPTTSATSRSGPATATMVPLGTLVDIKNVEGPSLISLYNLYPAATIVGGLPPKASARARSWRS